MQQSPTFSGTIDPIIALAYNVTQTGGVPVATEPKDTGWWVEADYNDGTNRLIELYGQQYNFDGTIGVRPIFSNFKRQGTTRQTCIGVMSFVGDPIQFYAPVNAGDQPVMVFNKQNPGGRMTIQSPDAGPAGIYISPPSANPGYLSIGYGATDLICYLTTASTNEVRLGFGSAPTTPALTYYRAGGTPNIRTSIGGADNTYGLTVFNGETGVGGIKVRALTGTSVPLLDLQTNAVSQLSVSAAGTLTLIDAANIVLGTTTGTMIGTATTQKLAFHNSAPVIQRAGVDQAAVATTAPTQTTPFGYTTSAQATAIFTLLNEIRATLVEKGLMKGAA
jgi:hypothetical protein